MLFEFKHVTKRKPVQTADSSMSGEPVLRDINFGINGKEPQLILGPSGSGKTTLLRLFNRLTDPDDGDILFHGKDIATYDVRSLRTRVGYVSQIPIMFDGTVLSNFQYAVQHMKNNMSDTPYFGDKCRELLRYLNVSDNILNRNAVDLSVGEKQRVALAAERLSSEIRSKRALIEARLSLGATSREAVSDIVASAARAAMIPTINSLMTVGIVSLPGMMTGQILSGASPIIAVKYQIVVMYMIAASVMISSVLIVQRGYKQFFTEHHQFRE